MFKNTIQFIAASTGDFKTGLPHADAGQDQLQQILQVVIAIIAALAVLFVVVSGLRFVLANGDSQSIAKARSALIYSLVGLVIAIMAQAIVTFVLFRAQ